MVLRNVRGLALLVIAAVGCGVIPVAMAGGTRLAGAPPVAGAWKLGSANNGAPEVKSGGFTVTSHQFVTGLHLIVGPGAETACGAPGRVVKVLGEQRLLRDPPSDLGTATNEYAVSSPTNVVEPVSVKVTVNGKRQAGQLEIAFGAGTRGGRRTGGEVYYGHGTCDLFFVVAKA
jgi:hypothetical protein